MGFIFRENREYLRRVFTYIILLGILTWFVIYLFRQKNELTRLGSISISDIFTISVFVILYKLSNAFMVKKLLQIYEINMSFKEWFGLSSITTMGNYILPAKSGIVARAIYMKKKYQFPYSKFTTSYFGMSAFLYFVNAALGAIFVYVIYLTTGIFYLRICLFFIAILLLVGIFMSSWKYLGKIKFWHPTLNSIFLGLNSLGRQKRFLFVLFLLNLASLGAMATRLFFAYRSLGIHVAPLQVLMISNILFFTFLISITPADLGIREAIIVITSTILGLRGVDGALVSIIDRGVSVIITFVLGLIFTTVLLKNLRVDDITRGKR